MKVQQDFFSTTDEMYTKLGEDGGGYDISFPISVDIPAMVERGVIQKLNKAALTNIGNLGEEWADPGYDPGNEYNVPYWWTTGDGCDPARLGGEAPTSRRRSGTAVGSAHLDA